MVALCVSEAEVLLTGNGLPLLTRHRFGQGHVYVLSVPTGAIKDPSLHFVWKHFAPAQQARPSVDDGAFAAPARRAIDAIAGRPAPSVTTPLTVLGVIAALALIAGLILRLRRRGEILWLVMVPAALVCGVVLWGIAQSRTAPEHLSYIGLVSGLENDVARAQYLFGYYSGPGSRELTFSAGGPRGLIEDIGLKAQAAFGRHETLCGPSVMLPGRSVQEDSTALFGVDAVVRTGAITGSLTFDSAGLTGQLTNNVGVDISSAIIYVNGQTYSLGDLPAGRTASVSVGVDDHLGAVTFVKRYAAGKTGAAWDLPKPKRRRTTRPAGPGRRRVRRPARRSGAKARRRGPATVVAEGNFTSSAVQDALFTALLGRFLTQPKIGRNVDRSAVLIGYTDSSLIDPLGGRELKRHGKCVVVWPLTLSRPAADTAVRIPEGFVRTTFINMSTPVWDAVNQRFNRSSRDSEILMLAEAPRAVGPLREARAVLTVGLHAPGFRVRIWGVGQLAEGRKVVHDGPPLKEVTNPSGEITLEIDNADRFRQAGGAYAFAIRVERTRSGKKPGKAARAKASTTWLFESIYVRLEGRANGAGSAEMLHMEGSSR